MNCCMHWPPVVGNCLHLPETTRWPKVFSDSIQKLQAVSSPTEWIQPFPISFVLSVIRGIARVMRNIKNHFRRKRTIRLISHRVNKLRGANPKVCDSSLTKRILKKEIPLLNPDNANRVSLPWFILFSHQVKIVNEWYLSGKNLLQYVLMPWRRICYWSYVPPMVKCYEKIGAWRGNASKIKIYHIFTLW